MRGLVQLWLLFAAALLAAGCRTSNGSDERSASGSTREHVGQIATNVYYTPANQLLTPAGVQVELPGMRPQAIAVSPNGRMAITAGKTHELVVLEARTGKILQRVPFPSDTDLDAAPGPVSQQILEPDKEGQLSFTGLIFSPDGRRIYLANVNGSIKVFQVDNRGAVAGLCSFLLPQANIGGRKADLPAGLALTADGKRLFVVLNLSNRLAQLDADNGKILRIWDVGVAPYDVVAAGNKVYVSNWGGRPPDSKVTTGPAGRGTLVRVDPVRFIASEGSVTVINLQDDAAKPQEPLATTEPAAGRKRGRAARSGTQSPSPVKSESGKAILTGKHACAMALSPDARWLVVANAGDDNLSVIDTRTDQITETISARLNPADLFGAQPNAVTFDGNGRRLFVCNGSQNAVALYDFSPGKTRLRGLMPVGWFPGAIAWNQSAQTICVANIKGIGSTKRYQAGEVVKYNSHQYYGTVSLVPVPSAPVLAESTKTVRRNMRYGLLEQAHLPARPDQPPRPVPERVEEPSVFKHVVYIIKENRAYDQVLGDISEANGDASLCVCGERITPNQHKLVREFVLLDNTYCSGILSADGHQWTDSGISTDYLEKSFAGFPRSYVHGMTDGGVDALAYSPAGFIWDNVVAHGKTLRDYGEFAITVARWRDKSKTRTPAFLDYFRQFTNGTDEIEIGSRPAIESLRPYLVTNTVGWALNIPDVFRARQFIKDLKQFEQTGGFPDLSIICLPNDHTSGTRAGAPTPAAQVADNDLAFGQIVEAVSHSSFWKDTCVIAIEDDPQAGWDHVSGYRTTCYVISPFTRRGVVLGTQYNQTSILRTMELILGLPPMNQMDATATPMSDCFTNVPNFAPYASVSNNVPLDQLNPEPKKISDARLRRHAYISATLPLAEPDKCPENTLNEILWTAMKGPEVPYPKWAVTAVDDDD
jgi:YVTN family beta-propeller protein